VVVDLVVVDLELEVIVLALVPQQILEQLILVVAVDLQLDILEQQMVVQVVQV
tara:strand:- start:15 stop:173 length:159 start_codon:yes stop_codon:yes gene_type:complete